MTNFNILHICNGYTDSKLYDELISRLASIGFQQTVIAPSFERIPPVSGKYNVLYFYRSKNIFQRLLYTRKLKKTQKYIENNVDIRSIKMIHAHTLFTDGIPTYRLHKKYGIKYIVAVRNSDINIFFKYYFHYHRLAHKVLKNASKIIIISPVYVNRLKDVLPKKIFEVIKDNIEVIPNGINRYWLNNRNITSSIQKGDTFDIVYCGSFDKNKNIDGLISAFYLVKQQTPNTRLILIGLKDGLCNTYVGKIKKLVAESNGNIILYGRLNKEEIIQIYRKSSIFAMPSHSETFGLVYVEALSQGIPIIYTKKEGFDGFFKNGLVGVAVDSNSVVSISNGINQIISDYKSFSCNVNNLIFDVFNWDNITNKYITIYKSTIQS